MRLFTPRLTFSRQDQRVAVEVIDVAADSPVVVLKKQNSRHVVKAGPHGITHVHWSPCGRFAALAQSSDDPSVDCCSVIDVDDGSVVARLEGRLLGWRSVQGVSLVAISSSLHTNLYYCQHVVARLPDVQGVGSEMLIADDAGWLEAGKWPRDLKARCRLLDAVSDATLHEDLLQKLSILELRFKELPVLSDDDVFNDGRPISDKTLNAIKTAWDDVVARAGPIAECSSSIRSLLATWQLRWEAASLLHDWSLLPDEEQFAPSRAPALHAALSVLRQPPPPSIPLDIAVELPTVQLRVVPVL